MIDKVMMTVCYLALITIGVAMGLIIAGCLKGGDNDE